MNVDEAYPTLKHLIFLLWTAVSSDLAYRMKKRRKTSALFHRHFDPNRKSWGYMIHAYLRNISSKKKTDTKNRLINVIKRAIMRSAFKYCHTGTEG
jgi:hypothetical protein